MWQETAGRRSEAAWVGKTSNYDTAKNSLFMLDTVSL